MKSKNGKGIFLVCEGPDGAGKTTHIEYMEKVLTLRGRKVKTFRAPGGTVIAEDIRRILVGSDYAGEEFSAYTEMMLYLASIRQLYDAGIKPALEAGFTVLCDRFYISTYAYQGYGRQLKDIFEKLFPVALADVKPDYLFFFDVSLEASLERIEKRNKEFNRLNAEALEFRKRCFEGYEKIIEENYFDIPTWRIDTMTTIESTQATLTRVLSMLD